MLVVPVLVLVLVLVLVVAAAAVMLTMVVLWRLSCLLHLIIPCRLLQPLTQAGWSSGSWARCRPTSTARS